MSSSIEYKQLRCVKVDLTSGKVHGCLASKQPLSPLFTAFGSEAICRLHPAASIILSSKTPSGRLVQTYRGNNTTWTVKVMLNSVLERMLADASAEPIDLPLSLLEDITNGFSHDQKIGSGVFAVVYKGILGNVTIAVKKLSNTLDIHEKQFNEEVSCLMKAKHKNIVRFLGYCSVTQGKMVDFEGKLVMADVRQRLLCFEYLPGGSLDKYITGSTCVLKWTECYQLIKEICEGLHYLHVERRIVHLDLKPTNILLDDNMVPKIADFGLSRRFCEKQSQIHTKEVKGTLGYMAPEFLNGQITFKSDICSLGIIITEILMRQKGCRDVEDVRQMSVNIPR